ncbi:MAG: hypothetical protein IJQ28_06985 [Clostridia bacterium]|nr:hypothetical protein [Clostridia bacterium]
MTCNCNDTHRVLTVAYTGTAIQLTVTDSMNIGNLERFNLVVCKPVSSLVTGAPVPVTITVNGTTNIPVKNAFGLPLMSDVVPYGKTCGRYVVDDSGDTPETYVILKTPCYA